MGTVGAERDRYILDAVRVPLTKRLPGVAGRLTEQILAEDDAYAALIPREELRARVLHNLQEALASLLERHEGRPVDLSDAVRTGRIRAEQGLPLASLQNAYRLGGRLMWATMIEPVAAESPDAVPSLLPCAGDLWDVLDLFSGAVADSYRLAESERLARDTERRNALLDVLLGGLGARVPVGKGAGLVAEAAAFLGLTERGRYAVAVVRSAPDGGETATARPGTSEAGGLRILWRIRADHEVGLIALGGCDLDEVSALSMGGGYRPVSAPRWVHSATSAGPAGLPR